MKNVNAHIKSEKHWPSWDALGVQTHWLKVITAKLQVLFVYMWKANLTTYQNGCVLCTFLSVPSQNITQVIKSRRIRCVGHVPCMGDMRGAYRVLMGKPEGKWPLGRLGHELEDNIKMDLQEVGGAEWIGLIWLRIGAGCKPLQMQYSSIKCGSFLTRWGHVSFWRRTLFNGAVFYEGTKL